MEEKTESKNSKDSRFSERKSLEKAMSLKDYISLGLGTIVGIGWIIFAGIWLTRGGPLGAMLAFIIGGLLLISVGKAFAELAPAIPVSGGGLAYSYKAFGTGFPSGLWL